MGEEIIVQKNDTMRAIEREMASLKEWDSPLCDQRVKAIVLTKLEEAWLWASKLIKA